MLEGSARPTDRFSPFAHAPRSCLGRNFAQMEMRLILAHVLRDHSFDLAPPYDVIDDEQRAALAARAEHNCVRVILPAGEGDARYPEGRRVLDAMRR